jgi:hypothetical protein
LLRDTVEDAFAKTAVASETSIRANERITGKTVAKEQDRARKEFPLTDDFYEFISAARGQTCHAWHR